jgi:hypothetical protein
MSQTSTALSITELSAENRTAQLGTRVTLKPSDMPDDCRAQEPDEVQDTQATATS